jgi:hypothetical protein
MIDEEMKGYHEPQTIKQAPTPRNQLPTPEAAHLQLTEIPSNHNDNTSDNLHRNL